LKAFLFFIGNKMQPVRKRSAIRPDCLKSYTKEELRDLAKEYGVNITRPGGQGYKTMAELCNELTLLSRQEPSTDRSTTTVQRERVPQMSGGEQRGGPDVTRPTGTRPTVTRPTATRPTGTGQTVTRPTGTGPTVARPTGTGPTVARQIVARPTATRPIASTDARPRVTPTFSRPMGEIPRVTPQPSGAPSQVYPREVTSGTRRELRPRTIKPTMQPRQYEQMETPNLEDIDQLEDKSYDDLATLREYLSRFRKFIEAKGYGPALDKLLRIRQGKLRREQVQNFLFGFLSDIEALSDSGEASESGEESSQYEGSSVSDVSVSTEEESEEYPTPEEPSEEEEEDEEDETKEEGSISSSGSVEYEASEESEESEESIKTGGKIDLSELDITDATDVNTIRDRIRAARQKGQLQMNLNLGYPLPTWEDIEKLDSPEYNDLNKLTQFLSQFYDIIRANNKMGILTNILRERDNNFRREQAHNFLSTFVAEDVSEEIVTGEESETEDLASQTSGEEPEEEEAEEPEEEESEEEQSDVSGSESEDQYSRSLRDEDSESEDQYSRSLRM
jgi:hypothetical protein